MNENSFPLENVQTRVCILTFCGCDKSKLVVLELHNSIVFFWLSMLKMASVSADIGTKPNHWNIFIDISSFFYIQGNFVWKCRRMVCTKHVIFTLKNVKNVHLLISIKHYSRYRNAAEFQIPCKTSRKRILSCIL